MVYSKLKIYLEVSEMSKELRRSISNMPKSSKFVFGDMMCRLLVDIKYQIYLANTTPGEEKLKEMAKMAHLLNKLEICMNDCIEDGSLQLKTKYSVRMPLKRLIEIKAQAAKWRTYAENNIYNEGESKSVETAKKIYEKFGRKFDENEKP